MAENGSPPQIAVQTVEMPQAGGGIQGIGEHLDGGGFSGRLSFGVPLRCSPCRGFEPQLELTYSSFDGNGLFGRGFDVAVSSLGRRTSRRIPRYDDSDEFALDGDQLTPVTGGAESRTVDGVGYEVTAFRRRVESSFARIERWASGAGEAFWRVLDRGGAVLVYGRTAAARVADPEDPGRTAEWLLEEAFGPRGDVRLYRYKPEGPNRYPERVCYGNEASYLSPDGGVTPLPDQEWHFELVFDYGEYEVDAGNEDPYAPVRDWASRPDSVSSYRFGFERCIRRLCRNLLMFHRFGAELGPSPVLVHALALDYEEDPAGTSLSSCQLVGFRFYPKQPAGSRYATGATPALELSYQRFEPDANTAALPLLDITGATIEGFGGGRGYAVADLDGLGVPGLVYADGETVSYRAPVLIEAGDLSWTAPRILADFPAERSVGAPGVELSDLNGNGVLDLVWTGAGFDGFYRSRGEGEWEQFAPFPSSFPDYGDPVYERADLTGDGRSDLVWRSGDTLGYFPALGEDGFGAARMLAPEPGMPPALAQEDPSQLVAFADLLGGGTACLVRVRDGSVECWPSLGYGRFAPVVEMDRAPRCEGEFDASRVYLADVDGGGAAAIVFAYADRVEVFRNLGGNGFAAVPVVVPLPAAYSRREQIRVADLLGSGTECLVFASEDPTPRLWSIDLCGGAKPYLLAGFDNGQGSRSQISYRSAAHERLRDQREGVDWVTRLPFPLQVVGEVVAVDEVSEARTAVSYRYHHGYYDHVEREARGFGMVETLDVERSRTLPTGADPAQAPPLLTKSWYQTGAPDPGGAIERAYRREFFDEDPHPWSPPPTELPAGAADCRQGAIALAGRPLREERYGLDGSEAQARPYDVAEHGYRVRTLQATGKGRYGAYLAEDRTSVGARYEREPADPRVTQHFVLAVDEFGDVLRECDVAYPRRPGALDPAGGQTEPRAVVVERAYHALTASPDQWLLGVPASERLAEVLDLPPPDVGGLYYSREAIAARVEAALAAGEVSDYSRHRYRYAGTPVTLPALLERSEEAVFAATLVSEVFAGQPLPEPLADFLEKRCGYRLDADGLWWDPGPLNAFAEASGFFRPCETSDALAAGAGTPAGTVFDYAYDDHSLLLVSTAMRSSGGDVLPCGIVASELDYVALAACQIRDENGTVHEAQRDPLGVVVLLSTYGTEWGDGAPREVGFAPLDFAHPPAMPSSLAELLADPGSYLGGALSRTYYDLDAWRQGRGPSRLATLEAAAYPGGEAAPIEVSLSYRDGSQRLVQRSDLVEPGPVHPGGPPANPRWRIRERLRYNNKGLPFQECQPAFSASYGYQGVPGPGERVAMTTTYDPLDRMVRAEVPEGEFPDAFFSTREHAAWSITSADRDDTVKDSPYYRYYVEEGHPGLDEWDRRALEAAAASHGTPEVEALDNRGFLSARRQWLTAGGAALVESFCRDALGRKLWAADPRLGVAGKRNVERVFSMKGHPLRIVSVDAGTIWMLRNALGKLVYSHDSRGFSALVGYDGLQRTVAVEVLGGDGQVPMEGVSEYYVYGDSLDASGQPPVADPADHNLIGREWRRYDSAGLVEQSDYSFTARPLGTAYWMRSAYREEANWRLPAAAGSWAERIAALAPALDDEAQVTALGYDAAGRPLTVLDAAGNERSVSYHVSGMPDRLFYTPAGGSTRAYVLGSQYDPNAQPLEVTFGDENGRPAIVTSFSYDPANWRLRREAARRVADGTALQDLAYHYDPTGNLTHVENRAPVGPATPSANRDYTYDALDRLVAAAGRAQAGYTEAAERAPGYAPFFAGKEEPEAELFDAEFHYDDGGNLTRAAYASASSRWATDLEVDPGSNRAVRAPAPSDAFDAAGNTLKLDGVDAISWSFANQPSSLSAESATQYMLYDAFGRRVAKVVEDGDAVARTLYLGTVERHRRTVTGVVTEEFDRAAIELGDHVRGVALAWRVGGPPAGAGTAWFQLSDLVGSSVVEVDGKGEVLHGEEYLPYGGTALAWSRDGEAGMSLKSRRHGGHERDLVGGLYYYGSRYQACWLGRWISPDPLLDGDGLNLYAFAGNNPVTYTDLFGLCDWKLEKAGVARQVPVNSSMARFARRIQEHCAGTRNIAVLKLVKSDDDQANREVLYLVARSMGQGVPKLTLGNEEQPTNAGTPRKRGHSEAVLLATLEVGVVKVGNTRFDLKDYKMEWVLSTNEGCGAAIENCGAHVIPRLAPTFAFVNRYTGTGQAGGFKWLLSGHLNRGEESEAESEGEDDDPPRRRTVRARARRARVAVIEEQEAFIRQVNNVRVGVNLKTETLSHVPATYLADYISKAPRKGTKRRNYEPDPQDPSAMKRARKGDKPD